MVLGKELYIALASNDHYLYIGTHTYIFVMYMNFLCRSSYHVYRCTRKLRYIGVLGAKSSLARLGIQ